jgi:hypothetical protein
VLEESGTTAGTNPRIDASAPSQVHRRLVDEGASGSGLVGGVACAADRADAAAAAVVAASCRTLALGRPERPRATQGPTSQGRWQARSGARASSRATQPGLAGPRPQRLRDRSMVRVR